MEKQFNYLNDEQARRFMGSILETASRLIAERGEARPILMIGDGYQPEHNKLRRFCPIPVASIHPARVAEMMKQAATMFDCVVRVHEAWVRRYTREEAKAAGLTPEQLREQPIADLPPTMKGEGLIVQLVSGDGEWLCLSEIKTNDAGQKTVEPGEIKNLRALADGEEFVGRAIVSDSRNGATVQ